MSLSIQPLGPGAIASVTQPTSLRQVALDQAASSNAASSVQMTALPAIPPDPRTTNPAFFQALGISAKMSSDLSNVADALVSTMQDVVMQRPDLATATFDFQSDQGSIKVVSDSLSDQDKAWLQNELNANQNLVNAVQAFHDDATKSYGLWAEVDGNPIGKAGIDQVSSKADSRFSFMSMFKQASQQMLKGMDPNGSYYTSNGAPMDFHQAVDSPLSFLVFQKSAQAVEDGTNTYVTSTGNTYYGELRGNLFSAPGVIPDFKPSMSSRALVLDEMA